MSYSLKQAADATGKERLTLQRAIKRGRISATLGESGAYEIDPSELHRVFPPVARNQAQPIATQQETASENRELKAKVELLREMVDDLRERLDKSEDERRATQTKLTTLVNPPAEARTGSTASTRTGTAAPTGTGSEPETAPGLLGSLERLGLSGARMRGTLSRDSGRAFTG